MNTLTLNINDKEQLFKAYMPFIKNGGLFVATPEAYQMGQEVKILLKLLEEAREWIIPGKVVWMTPLYAQANRPAGVGVQFDVKTGNDVRAKIESYLGDKLTSDQPTDTL